MGWKSHWEKNKRGSILQVMKTVTILQNCRRGIPMLPMKPPFHLVKTGLWCAVTSCKIPAPIFLENTNNSKLYSGTVLDFLERIPMLKSAQAWFH
jgi:hypothetical protein